MCVWHLQSVSVCACVQACARACSVEVHAHASQQGAVLLCASALSPKVYRMGMRAECAYGW